MNIPLKFILLFMTLTFCGNAQVEINYYDQSQSYPGPWVGDTNLFFRSGDQIISDGLPQTPSDIFLFSNPSLSLPIEWEMEASIHCATSSGNYLELLLFSDTTNFSASRFVRIGGTLDEVALIANEGGIETRLIDGPDGMINSSSLNKIWLRVILTDSLQWQVFFSNALTSPNWQIIGTVQDSSFNYSDFSGIHVRHSSGNKDKYRLQQFSIRAFVPDTIAPVISRALRLNDQQLDIYFSEPIYSYSNIVSPTVDLSSASVTNVSNSRIRLSFPSGTTLPYDFIISADSLIDLENNLNIVNSRLVENAGALFGELIISEVFADPEPSIGPFSDEFIELFNRSDHPIQLENLDFCDASTCVTLPDFLLEPGEYFVISSGDFPDSVPHYSSSALPSLNNYDDDLIILNSSGKILHFLNYSDQWYDDPNKQEGGYSLECISPDILCGDDQNWIASTDPSGATPGHRNSVYEPNVFLLSEFEPEYIKVISEDIIIVHFSGNIHPESEIQLSITNGNDIPIDSIVPVAQSLFIYLSVPLESNILYSLIIESIIDCEGNQARLGEWYFCRTENIEIDDIIITEILFDPFNEDSDFFEILNTSDHPIALDGLLFSTIRNGVLYQIKEFPPGIFLPSGEVLAFSENKMNTAFNYPKGNENNIIEVNSLPIFPNESGSLILLHRDSSVISRLDYSSHWHHPSLQTREGVSLTLRDRNFGGNSPDNWRSSTFDEGWGTPGKYFSDTSTYLKTAASPLVFSPDSDGHDDNVSISLVAENESLVSVMVYTEWGQLIRVLSNEELIGSKMAWAWDGTDSGGMICDKGIYVIFIKAKAEGKQDQFFRYVVQLL